MLSTLKQYRQCRKNGCYYALEASIVATWLVATVLVHSLVKPPDLGFFCDDHSIMYPYLPDTIPDAAVIGVTLGLPILIMVVIEVVSYLLSRRTTRLRPERSHKSGLVEGRQDGVGGCCWVVRVYIIFFFGYNVMNLLVMVLKLTTGQHRPHFMVLCKPEFPSSTYPPCHGQYVSEFNCTNEDNKRELANARLSFPSGHAAYAGFMSAFLILYVERRVVTRHLHLAKLSFHSLLTLYAMWVSVSRVTDNMHHVRDVVVGALLGVFLAIGFFNSAVERPLRGNTANEERNSDNDVEDNDTTMNNNNNRSDDDDDMENGNLDALDIETPTTPTPLLFNGVSLSTNTGLRIGPLRLEGDKHKFPRRATLQ